MCRSPQPPIPERRSRTAGSVAACAFNHLCLLICCWSTVALGTTAAFAQSPLLEETFSEGIPSQWNLESPWVDWRAVDEMSGALVLPASAPSGALASRCLDVRNVPAGRVSATWNVVVQGGAGRSEDPRLALELDWYADAECSRRLAETESRDARPSHAQTSEPMDGGVRRTELWFLKPRSAVGALLRLRTESPSSSVSLSIDSVRGEPVRRAFLTSESGSADLATWTASSGMSGLDGALEICEELADQAGLAGPENFVPWLSTATDDAYCTLLGLSGKVAANCGEGSPPSPDAGPWIRLDGVPFAADLDAAIGAEDAVYTPLVVDENGVLVPGNLRAFTGSDGNGALEADGLYTTCGDWSNSSTDLVWIGRPNSTSISWSTNGGTTCQTPSHLYCLERGAGASVEPDPPPAGSNLAFVTSITHHGDLSTWPHANGETGIDAGDEVCKALAQTAGYDRWNGFRAWLSDSSTDAASRFPVDVAWYRPDGIRVADDLADLTDGHLLAPINLDDLGFYRGNFAVATGTTNAGLATTTHCSNWTSSGDSGADADKVTTGTANDSGNRWSSNSSPDCDFTTMRLYCLDATPGPIFTDGFETGDVSAWM